MFGDNKNLKDSLTNLSTTIKDSSLSISYQKTNKLIMALYMVTDMIDKDEPLRNKLRTLGIEILSDNTSLSSGTLGHLSKKIQEVLSFLDISSAVNIISEMNCSILRKEFLELNQSIISAQAGKEYDKLKTLNGSINLADFFREELPASSTEEVSSLSFNNNQSKGHYQTIGHQQSTRIGVQKGSTLMKALSDRKLISSLGSSANQHKSIKHVTTDGFDVLKKERRNEVINFITKNGGNATITDIKKGAHGSIVSCSEKTLQRELVSMVKDGVLNKTGEKRWSRYFLKS